MMFINNSLPANQKSRLTCVTSTFGSRYICRANGGCCERVDFLVILSASGGSSTPGLLQRGLKLRLNGAIQESRFFIFNGNVLQCLERSCQKWEFVNSG